MDALKNLANKAGSGSTTHNNAAPAQAGQKEDYLDKGKMVQPTPSLHISAPPANSLGPSGRKNHKKWQGKMELY